MRIGKNVIDIPKSAESRVPSSPPPKPPPPARQRANKMLPTARIRRKEPKESVGNIVKTHAVGYCEVTSLHGFAYWVSAPRVVEKAFWVFVVVIFGLFATLIINHAVTDWINKPSVTKIETFSKVGKAEMIHVYSLNEVNVYRFKFGNIVCTFIRHVRTD